MTSACAAFSQVRFVLMNSFSTSKDTKEFLSARHADLLAEDDVELVQNKSPKIDAKTLEPATYPPHPEQEWCVAFHPFSLGWNHSRHARRIPPFCSVQRYMRNSARCCELLRRFGA